MICIYCKEPIKVSEPISWGATAIENTMPVEVENWHFDCKYEQEKS